ncbi:hypothetical protein [Flocculibacter collagenilyticus]|uniref:hypothetical protein n=1 Tax=Flocculibacter collagenilyticus TaxID=2744479 RepID=UPI0018F76A36|nr:hypothetical protein [Flocculibacter collagenilyticus]
MDKVNLSGLNKVEKSILMELTDFNSSLRQVAIDMHFEDTCKSVGKKFETAENAIIHLLELGLISIQKNKYTEIPNNEILLAKSEELSFQAAKEHLRHPANWMSDHGMESDLIYFEIAPTDRGEVVLDALFEYQAKT